jgi:hypothetical protein
MKNSLFKFLTQKSTSKRNDLESKDHKFNLKTYLEDITSEESLNDLKKDVVLEALKTPPDERLSLVRVHVPVQGVFPYTLQRTTDGFGLIDSEAHGGERYHEWYDRQSSLFASHILQHPTLCKRWQHTFPGSGLVYEVFYSYIAQTFKIMIAFIGNPVGPSEHYTYILNPGSLMYEFIGEVPLSVYGVPTKRELAIYTDWLSRRMLNTASAAMVLVNHELQMQQEDRDTTNRVGVLQCTEVPLSPDAHPSSVYAIHKQLSTSLLSDFLKHLSNP